MKIFIFRRDLRFQDNVGLHHALKSGKIIPIFIFNKDQVTSRNSYKSVRAIQFMCERLANLKINLYYGSDAEILGEFKNVTDVFTNMDYTPFAIERDRKLKCYCDGRKINFHIYEDYLLAPINTFTRNDTAYKVFTPFYNKYKTFKPKKYRTNIKNLVTKKYTTRFSTKLTKFACRKISQEDKRTIALSLIKNNKRGLSPYIKFGCVSVRECYKNKDIRRNLIWREFYYYIGYYNQYVLCRNFRNIHKIKWQFSEKKFENWKNGNTGIEKIDEAMKELKKCGFINNRKRLICSNYLCMTLKIHWKHGEKYFATQLVDYDPYVNNGNWQWNAGTGSNTRPYNQQKIVNF